MNIINEYKNLCRLSGCYIRIKNIKKNKDQLIWQNITWHSSSLVKFLRQSDQLFFTAMTAGPAILEKRDLFLENGETYPAVIIDAMASEMVEEALNWLNQYLAKLLIREVKCLTRRRYSPGYGDFSLQCQKDLFTILKLDDINLKLTDHCLLIPEKSVTAVIGIENSSSDSLK